MSFRIHALDPAPFAPLFALTERELEDRLCRRVVATHRPGFPCRVSLQDAAVGEELVLAHFEHQPAATPFRASHAVYVRRNATRAVPAADEVPAFLRTRTLSLRAFNAEGMLLAAKVVAGSAVEADLSGMLRCEGVASIHLHNAAMGCYLARADPA